MFAHAFDVDAEGFVLPNFVAFRRAFVDGNEQVLNLFVINFHHGRVDFVLLLFVGVARNPIEDLFASDGHDSLSHIYSTLLAPYPTIEYDLPAPVCPYANRQQ